MGKLFKNSKRWMTALGVVAFLMVAGWQVGTEGAQEVFAETEVALENAVAGTGSGEFRWHHNTCSNGTPYECCTANGDGNSCSEPGTCTRQCT